MIFSLHEGSGVFVSLLHMNTSLDPEGRKAVPSLSNPNAATDFVFKQVRYVTKVRHCPWPALLLSAFIVPPWWSHHEMRTRRDTDAVGRKQYVPLSHGPLLLVDKMTPWIACPLLLLWLDLLLGSLGSPSA